MIDLPVDNTIIGPEGFTMVSNPMCINPLTKLTGIGGRLYSTVYRRDTHALELRDYTGPAGELTVKSLSIAGKVINIQEGYLISKRDHGIRMDSISAMVAGSPTGGWEHYAVDIHGLPTSVPPGEYMLLLAGDPQGKLPMPSVLLWKDTVRIKAGHTLTITGSQTPRLVIDSDPELARGSESQIPMHCRCGVFDDFLTGSAETAVPKVSIESPQGVVLTRGSAAYDESIKSGLDASYTLPVLAEWEPGLYTITATLDLGPFGGTVKRERTVLLR
jgi:hypothetical protein